MNTLMHSNSGYNNEKGFTLIEVVIAMGIFAIGILAVANMQLTASYGNRSARLKTEAVAAATEYMENLLNQGYAALSSGSATEDGVRLTWNVADDTPVTDTRTINLTASWDDRGGTRTADFNYIITNPN